MDKLYACTAAHHLAALPVLPTSCCHTKPAGASLVSESYTFLRADMGHCRLGIMPATPSARSAGSRRA